MNLYALPSLVGSVLSLILAIIIWLNRRRDRLNVALAVFIAGVAMFCWLLFLLRQAPTLPVYQRRLLATIFAQPLLYGTGLYYVLVLTGLIDDLSTRVAGVSVRGYLVGLGVLAAVTLTAFAVPGFLIKGYVHREVYGFDIVASPLLYPLVALQVIGLVPLFAYLLRALSETDTPSRRRFLQHNVIALALVWAVAIAAGILAPRLGFHLGPVLMEISLAASAVLFYGAILRYQFDRSEELTAELESRFKERTRHLAEAQARLVQKEKMAALGKLAAGIVHEVNSPLGVLNSSMAVSDQAVGKIKNAVAEAPSIETLRDDRKFNRAMAVLQDNSKTIEAASARISDLVSSLKNFARLDESDIGYADLHEGIDSSLALLRNELGEHVEVVRDYGDLPRIYCNPSEINQVFMNILRNAAKAIKGSGKLTIATWPLEDDRVAVAITDSGAGIPQQKRASLFDFKFNIETRRVRLGMGLATSYQLVQRHGGEIQVFSEEGKGSTFTVVLPVKADLTDLPTI